MTLPYRPLADPVPVLVTVAGRELPGTALGWRGQRVYLSWIVGRGLQHLGWKDVRLLGPPGVYERPTPAPAGAHAGATGP